MEIDNSEVRIRPAVLGDEEAVGHVHVRSWQSTYGGILPAEFLDGLSVAARVDRWRERIAAPGEGEFSLVAETYAAEGRPTIVGFVGGGPERDGIVGPEGMTYDGEVYAIYLLAGWRRQGVGRRLMAASVEVLVNAGRKSIVVWVLKDNASARHFYEALGGVPVGEKPITIGQTALREIAYGWSDARRLFDSASRSVQ